MSENQASNRADLLEINVNYICKQTIKYANIIFTFMQESDIINTSPSKQKNTSFDRMQHKHPHIVKA